MDTLFIDMIAETNEELYALTGSEKDLLIFEVYDGEPSEGLEQAIGLPRKGEKYIRFNLQKHSQTARQRFLEFPEFVREAYGFPECKEKPLPYLRSFVFGSGFIDTVFSVNQVAEFLKSSRKEQETMIKIRRERGDCL